MSADRRSDWQQAYQSALLEVDPKKLRDRIRHAYAAIEAYQEQASKNNVQLDHEALSDALSNLRVLRREASLPANDSDKIRSDTPAPGQKPS